VRPGRLAATEGPNELVCGRTTMLKWIAMPSSSLWGEIEVIAPLSLAVGCFVLFLLAARLTRIGVSRQPNVAIVRLHHRLAAVYVVLAIAGTQFSLPQPGVFDWLIGLLVYYALYYAVLWAFVALATRSISSRILLTIQDSGGRLSEEQVQRELGSEESLAELGRDRVRWAEHFRFISTDDLQVRLTTRGAMLSRLAEVVLGVWGLRPLGSRDSG